MYASPYVNITLVFCFNLTLLCTIIAQCVKHMSQTSSSMVKVSIRFGGSSTNRGTVDILRPEFVFFEMVGENAQFDGIACLSEGEKQHLRVINVL